MDYYDGLSWAPQRRVFIRRSLILAVGTFVAFTALILIAITNWQQYLLVPLALTMILAMDDFNRWRQVRDERWAIEDGHLIHDGQDGRAAIPLCEIDSVKRRLGSAVVITLHSGQRIMMRYLPYPAQTADQINNARTPEEHDEY